MREAPGRWLYGLAAVIFVIGVTGTLLFFITRLQGLDDRLLVAKAPGRTELHLRESGQHTIFVENSPYPTGLKLKLTEKGTGSEVRMWSVRGRYTYSIGDRSGVGVMEFEISQPGIYILEAVYPDSEGPQATLTVARQFTMYLLVTILGSLILGFATAGTALVIGVVTFVKRYKAARPLPM